MTDKLYGYDIIGDINGHAEALQQLLLKLGYHQNNKVPEGLSYMEYLFHAPDSMKDVPTGYEYGHEGYHPRGPAVFFGHYWLDGKLNPA